MELETEKGTVHKRTSMSVEDLGSYLICQGKSLKSDIVRFVFLKDPSDQYIENRFQGGQGEKQVEVMEMS